MRSWPASRSKAPHSHRLAAPAAFALLALWLAAPDCARAQVTVSLTAESDYRLRGVSLTNGRPDVRLGVGYDHASGAYGGGALIAGKDAGGGVRALGHVAYVGYARRVGRGFTVDVGAINTRVTTTVATPLTGEAYPTDPYAYAVSQTERYASEYSEAYVGAIRGQTSVHVYLSPDYLGSGRTTAYLDLGTGVRASSRVRLFWHAGLLTPVGGSGGSGPARVRTRYDMRTGVALDLGVAQVQLAWTAMGPRLEYPVGYTQKRHALVVSATASF